MDFRRFYQIDSDYRRRAQFVQTAQDLGTHLEPFDSPAELVRFAPVAGVVFAHDDRDAIPQAIELLGRAALAMPVVAYREGPSAEMIVDAINAGACDYVSWPIFPDTLRRRLRALAQREEGEGQARMRRACAVAAIRQLSPRESEVLGLVATGATNKEIAAVLGISHRTVEIHRANMMVKLGQTSAAGALHIAYDAGLAEEPGRVPPRVPFSGRRPKLIPESAATNP